MVLLYEFIMESGVRELALRSSGNLFSERC
jgi:hypothetical protein